jgi:hypothetical protein
VKLEAIGSLSKNTILMGELFCVCEIRSFRKFIEKYNTDGRMILCM